jgi:phospholipid/cholesterol/gamma-HCH transport system substrate-binding protein
MKFSKEFLVGILVVFTIAAMYLGINYLKGVNVFSRQLRYVAVYDNIAGLVSSNSVVINGYKIGIVKSVALSKAHDGKIAVEVIINDNSLQVPEDTKLEIYDSDLLGGKAIQIILGVSPNMAESGDTLIGTVQRGLTETIKEEMEPLRQKTYALFSGVDSVLSNLNSAFRQGGKEDIGVIFAKLKQTLVNLETTTGNLNQLIEANQGKLGSIFSHAESITANLENNNGKITSIVNHFDAISDSLSKIKFSTTMSKVDKAMGDFATITGKINQGQGTLGQLVNNDSLHKELVAASHELNLLIDDIQIHPKRYLSFSVFGKKDADHFSKRELEEMRKQIDIAIQEKSAKDK